MPALWDAYLDSLVRRPVATKAVTAGICGAVSDLIASKITVISAAARRRDGPSIPAIKSPSKPPIRHHDASHETASSPRMRGEDAEGPLPCPGDAEGTARVDSYSEPSSAPARRRAADQKHTVVPAAKSWRSILTSAFGQFLIGLLLRGPLLHFWTSQLFLRTRELANRFPALQRQQVARAVLQTALHQLLYEPFHVLYYSFLLKLIAKFSASRSSSLLVSPIMQKNYEQRRFLSSGGFTSVGLDAQHERRFSSGAGQQDDPLHGERSKNHAAMSSSRDYRPGNRCLSAPAGWIDVRMQDVEESGWIDVSSSSCMDLPAGARGEQESLSPCLVARASAEANPNTRIASSRRTSFGGFACVVVQESWTEAKAGLWNGVKACWTLWPIVQLVLYRYVPEKFQVGVTSGIAVLFNVYLTWIATGSCFSQRRITEQVS